CLLEFNNVPWVLLIAPFRHLVAELHPVVAGLNRLLNWGVGELQQAAQLQFAVVQHVSAAARTHGFSDAFDFIVHLHQVFVAVLGAGIVAGSLERRLLPGGRSRCRRRLQPMSELLHPEPIRRHSLTEQSTEAGPLGSVPCHIDSFRGRMPLPLISCQPDLLESLSSAMSVTPSHRRQPGQLLTPGMLVSSFNEL
uniref:Secreted protein n=1 Tax=Macrostomum lignano TaxID=282301 RepID=A0A1I8FUY4_9PLAT